jgi:hypothetical protein
MANLFWKTKSSTTRLLATPFKTEDEFEASVFETPPILEEYSFSKGRFAGGTSPAFQTSLASTMMEMSALSK